MLGKPIPIPAAGGSTPAAGITAVAITPGLVATAIVGFTIIGPIFPIMGVVGKDPINPIPDTGSMPIPGVGAIIGPGGGSIMRGLPPVNGLGIRRSGTGAVIPVTVSGIPLPITEFPGGIFFIV